MEHQGTGWLRPWGLPAVPAGVGLLELALVRLAGPPAQQVEVLRQLGEGGTDPVAPLLALLALGAQGLAAYLLLVLGLRLLALAPGVLGRLAAGAALRVTPVALRRALDLLLGGALLAQVTLASFPARGTAAPPPLAAVATTTAPAGRPPAPLPPWLTPRPRPTGPAATPETAPDRTPETAPGPAPELAPGPTPGTAPDRTRGAVPVPTPSGSGAIPTTRPAVPGTVATTRPTVPGAASARRPGGSGPASRHGQGRSEGADGPGGTHGDGSYAIRPGDTLWGIAAAHLPPAKRSAAAIDRYWRRIYRANRAVLGPDPDLIHPGTRLRLPPDRPDRR